MSKLIKYFNRFIFAILLFNHFTVFSQVEREKDSIRIMFYNVENLFDPFDDSLTLDEEFTSEGARHWTWNKFQKKVSGIYKTIVSMGNPLPPAIIGLCEIENRFVLNQLVYKSPFSKMDYRIVHEESPDRRGTDVALLFDPERVELMGHQAINIQFPFSPETRTRDILYSKLLVFKEDTIHVFVNHWPSRWGGQMASAPKRNFVADILKIKTDSILNLNPNANIIILGDFNDEPDDESIRDHLYARSIEDSTLLVNLMASEHADKMIGSHKYRENWGTLDQVIISNCLLLPDHSIQVKNKKAHIFNASFLMENDETFVGLKPYRTFVGFKYNGGYSDHLPIYFDLFKVL